MVPTCISRSRCLVSRVCGVSIAPGPPRGEAWLAGGALATRLLDSARNWCDGHGISGYRSACATKPSVARTMRATIEDDGVYPLQMREIDGCVVFSRAANSACVCPVVSRCLDKLAIK